MEKYISFHTHFYQPPRENPWLDEIESQDSAFPFHDWNERITYECYLPNSASRILDKEQKIKNIVNNYENFNFNFGPTLISWIEKKFPQLYSQILQADKKSIETSGHGNAIAQCYNHIIMPLATSHDKETQIIWAIADFEFRFKRKPQGMWLPETAVDIETLKLLAKYGIKYTILAPEQAKAIKPLDTSASSWINVSNGKIDPTMPYKVLLPDGNHINIFFFDGSISRSIAFDPLVLQNGEEVIKRVLSGFSQSKDHPQIVLVANDGETYGHHHKFAEMAISYAFDAIQKKNLARIVNLSYFLEKFPPIYEVQIFENTAWSCSHGVERWRSDCGCKTGDPKWNQQWRQPLREALNYLKSKLDLIFEIEGKKLLIDPWKARNEYINVILTKNKDDFFKNNAKKSLSSDEQIKVLKLLEMQKFGMFMFTSCGWFFDEISRLEPMQNLKYAARAIELAYDYNKNLEYEFLNILKNAKSNIPQFRDAEFLYLNLIKPLSVSLRRVVAHYSIIGLYKQCEQETNIYCYKIKCIDKLIKKSGENSLNIGLVEIQNQLTEELEKIIYSLIHLGGLEFHCMLKGFLDTFNYEKMKNDLSQKFDTSIVEVIRGFDTYFEKDGFGFKDLLGDEKREILYTVLEDYIVEIRDIYADIFERNKKLYKDIANSKMSLPQPFKIAAEYTTTHKIKRILADFHKEDKKQELKEMVKEAKFLGILNKEHYREIENYLKETLEYYITNISEPPDLEYWLNNIFEIIQFTEDLDVKINIWNAQNFFWKIFNEKLIVFEDETFKKIIEKFSFSKEIKKLGNS